MKSVLIAIRPKWTEKIASGQKTIEVRKTAPKDVPFKAYIYCCKAKPYLYKEANPPFELFLDSELYKGTGYDDRLFSGKVIGEFICDKVDGHLSGWDTAFGDIVDTTPMCLTVAEILNYSAGKPLYFWHISDLKIYDKPKELSEFRKPCNWNYDCCTCKRAKYELTKAEAKVFYGCDSELTRPPQSWCYVEDLGEEK